MFFSKYLRNILKFLHSIILDVNKILFTENPSNSKIFMFAILCLNFIIIFSLCLYDLINDFNIDDSKMGSLMLSLIISMVNVKYGTLFVKRRQIAKIMKILEKFQFKNGKFEKFKFIYGCYTVILIMISTFSAMRNLILGIRNFTILSKFPIEIQSFGIFSTVLIWIHLTQVFSLIVNFKFDILTYKFITITSMQFWKLRDDFKSLKSMKVLKRNIRKLDEIEARIKLFELPGAMPSTSRSINLLSKLPPRPPSPQPVTVNELLKLIKHQEELHKIAEDLKNIFNFSFTYSFAINSLIICALAFRVSINEFSTSILIGGLTYNLMRSYMQSFFAQMLKNSSGDVKHGIYECGWEDFEDIKIQKLINIALAQAQREKTFKSFGIWENNNEQYLMVSVFKESKYSSIFHLQVINTAYSWYTICLNLYN